MNDNANMKITQNQDLKVLFLFSTKHLKQKSNVNCKATLKVIYKGFLNSCIVLYASETSSSNHYV